MTNLQARVLVPGAAKGSALLLEAPVSLWGGVDLENGQIRDVSHPQKGLSIAGEVLVMTSGRGSSSSASAIVEMVRRGSHPSAIILLENDPILVMGALVANDLYDAHLPILQCTAQAIANLPAAERLIIKAADIGDSIVIWSDR